MSQKTCILIGAPVDSGKRRPGCLMGPDAYRTAGLAEALSGLGHQVKDLGNLAPAPYPPETDESGIFARNETIGWTQSLALIAQETMSQGLPVFLGGDHSLSLGSVVGVAD